jgi:hypothetical protein
MHSALTQISIKVNSLSANVMLFVSTLIESGQNCYILIKAAKGTCRYKEASMKKATVSRSDPVIDIPRNDTNTMMRLLANNQLISVGIAVVRSFKSYK